MKYPRLVSMPSAVSNWLEEQLEALGIDSAIYTRYILSLLHADVLDVIYPEDDYFLTKLKKEGNRNTLNSKRFRRSKSWRRNMDADQIKRSAAVECLMSAAEQSCEIESLVDQLCEKLKEVNSETGNTDLISNDDLSATIEGSMNKTVSPKELAEKYYAAFPALNHKSEPSYISTNINLVLDKWPSDKTRTDLITAKWITPDSSRKSKRKPPATMDSYNAIRRDFKRNRFGHKRTYCGRNLTMEMADNFNNWQRLCWYTGNYDANIMAGEAVENEVVNNNSVPDDLQVEPVNAPVDVAVPNDMLGARRPSLVDDAESSSDSESSISLDEELSEYEDTAIKEEYNRPSLTSSTRCISRCIENTADEGEPSSAEGQSEQCLSLGLNTAQIDDSAYRPGCHAELLAIQVATSVLNDTPPHVPVEIERPAGLLMIAQPQNFYPNLTESTEDDYQNFSEMLIRNGASYARAGHVVNGSAFCEYRRPPADFRGDSLAPQENVPSNGGMETFMAPLEGRASTPLESKSVDQSYFNFGRQIYFTPLTVLTAVASGSSKSEEEPKKYKDGTTFQVDSSLQKVEYKKSEDGCLYRNTASGVKVYREFKESGSSSQNQAGQDTKEKFTVKYLIDKVDKACQTGEDSAEQLDFMGIANLYQLSEVVSIGELLGDLVGQLPLGPLEETDAEVHSDFTEPGDAVKISDEVDWSCTPKSSNVFCKHCNNQHPWPGNLPKELNVGSNERSLKEIWGGTEMCGACPWSSKPPTPLEETTSKLREESREEADQLLSDLNSLQLSNVTELKVWQPIKRRHSQTDNLINDDWSFASLLQEDFLGSLPALPARRPVRL